MNPKDWIKVAKDLVCTEDAVEVVRCKDCKNWMPESHSCRENGGTWGKYEHCSRGRTKTK